jgi:hypothetical protein
VSGVAVAPGPKSLEALAWLARVGASPIEPLGLLMGWNRILVYDHVRRLERAGLVTRVAMRRGHGSLIVATSRGAIEAGYPAARVLRSVAPTTWAHSSGWAWASAWLIARLRVLRAQATEIPAEALLSKTFNLGLDVGRGKDKVALVRLRLAKALVGVAEANALAAESIAIEHGVTTQQIAEAEALSLLAAAFNGMPDPVFHLTACVVAISIGLAAIEPDPRAAPTDMMLDAALQAATGLQQLLQFRGNVVRRDDRRAARHGDRAAAERANAAGGRGRSDRRVFQARRGEPLRPAGPARTT